MEVKKILVKKNIYTTVMEEKISIVIDLEGAKALRNVLGKTADLYELFESLDRLTDDSNESQ